MVDAIPKTKNSPRLVGFLQALGLVVYVGAFAFAARTVVPLLKARFPDSDPDPMLPLSLFLLAFVTSALMCGAIALGYPIRLFFQEQKEAALQIVLWTIAWLAICGILLLVGALIL